jgi:hypothetical protein
LPLEKATRYEAIKVVRQASKSPILKSIVSYADLFGS